MIILNEANCGALRSGLFCGLGHLHQVSPPRPRHARLCFKSFVKKSGSGQSVPTEVSAGPLPPCGHSQSPCSPPVVHEHRLVCLPSRPRAIVWSHAVHYSLPTVPTACRTNTQIPGEWWWCPGPAAPPPPQTSHYAKSAGPSPSLRQGGGRFALPGRRYEEDEEESGDETDASLHVNVSGSFTQT